MIEKVAIVLKSKYPRIFLLLLGLVTCLGYAPFHVFPITIFSFFSVIYFFTNLEKSKINIFFYGFLFSLSQHLGLLYWIAISFETANAGGYFLGSIAVLILCAFLSIFPALGFYLLFKFFNNYKSLNFGIFFIFIFTFFDWLKGNILWGFPWTPISSMWTINSTFLYPFSVLGVWGYSLITYGLIISVYYFLFSTKKGLFFLFPFVFIIFVLPNILKVNENIVDVLNVRIVQPNIKQEDKWDERKLKKNLEKLSKIITLNDYKNFDLIVLPETALNLNVNNLNLEQYLENFDLESIKNFIVGTIRVEGEKKNIKIFNSMYLIKSDNKKPIYHDKLKLVPFGEFIPFKDTLGLNKLSDGAVDFSKGKKVKSLNINKKINFLPLICYEVIFPKLSSNIKGSYNLLINITNDAWYKKSSGPYQHFSLSKIRAVMEGLTLIRVANTGISGIIGPKGTTLIKLGLQKDGTIDYKLDIKEVKTIYGRHGESLFYLIMLTLLCHICISFFYGKSNKDKYL